METGRELYKDELQEVVEVLKSCKKYVSKKQLPYAVFVPGDKFTYICYALDHLQNLKPVHRVGCARARTLVMKALQGCFTFGEWVVDHNPHLDRTAYIGSTEMQKLRHQWLDQLIHDYEVKLESM